MKFKNTIEFSLSGNYALFTDPITRMGGEKSTYLVPTYEALKGVCESIYWKPTIIWIVDKVRVMKPITTETKGIRPLKYSEGGNDLANYTYLKNVEYHVSAHFIRNEQRPDLYNDYNENKHYFIAKRYLEKGGRRDIFLGTRECGGYIEPCAFEESAGHYDNVPENDFGLMFHSFLYPSVTGKEELVANLDYIKMLNGVIQFNPPEKVRLSRTVKEMEYKIIKTNGLTEFDGLLKNCEEDI